MFHVIKRFRISLAGALAIMTACSLLLGWRTACYGVLNKFQDAAMENDFATASELLDARSGQELLDREYESYRCRLFPTPYTTRSSALLRGCRLTNFELRIIEECRGPLFVDRFQATVTPWGISEMRFLGREEGSNGPCGSIVL